MNVEARLKDLIGEPAGVCTRRGRAMIRWRRFQLWVRDQMDAAMTACALMQALLGRPRRGGLGHARVHAFASRRSL